MQKTQKENKKSTQLPPPGATPEVLNPQVISPHHIEREFHLKKIDSLRYTTREQKRTIASLRDNLKIADVSLDELVKKLETKQELVNALHSSIKTKYRLYKDLHNAYTSLSSDYKKVAQLNNYLLLSKECKPEIQQAIKALKLPVHLN